MKKKIFKVLVIIYLSFFVSGFASAASCVWTPSVTKMLRTGSGTGITLTPNEECPDGTTVCGNCSGQKPQGSLCCSEKVPIVEEPKFKMPDFVFQTPIPGLAKLSTVTCTDTCEIPWISEYIFAIYNYGLTIVGVIAVLTLMAAGLLWIVSGGDSSKITQAKSMIMGSVTGLLLLVSMSLLLSYINPDLIKNKTIKLDVIKEIVLNDNEVISLSETPYGEACTASRNGDLSVCEASARSNVKPANLVTLEGKEVNSDFAESYKKAIDCVNKKNNGKVLFKINEGWRSPAKQIKYYNTYLKEGSPRAAKPCCSNHGSGQAADINRTDGNPMTWSFNDSSGLKICMNDNSLYANLSDEPWHWSPSGN